MAPLSETPTRTPAYVLRTIDYREADRIITLLTRTHGRLSAIARNARRSRKRFGGKLESFMELSVELRPGRGDLVTLHAAEVTRAHLGVVSNLSRLRAAGACLELVRVVAPEREPEPRLFDAVGRLLQTMETTPADETADRALSFCGHALALIGWAPEVERCGVTGRRCPPERPALFDPRRGSVVSRAAGGGPLLLHPETRRALTDSFGARWPTVRWSARGREQAREAIRALLRAQTDRELSSAWVSALGG